MEENNNTNGDEKPVTNEPAAQVDEIDYEELK